MNGTAQEREHRPVPWYRAQWVPLAAALAVIAVIAVAAGVGLASGGRRNRSCDARVVAELAMPSVVTILVQSSDGGRSNGSGSFLDASGHILTNNHVVSPAAAGGRIAVQRPNGEVLDAKLVGRDNDTDLAVISVVPKSPAEPLPLGDAPVVGDRVFAIGAPMGLADTLTAGVVSSLGRSVRVPADHGSTALIASGIQTDASINPGNSGGALVSCTGELVGVPTAGSTPLDSLGQPVAGSIGLGFAIPAAFAHRVAELLIAHGEIASQGDFGMSVVPVSRGDDPTSADGLHISAVAPGGAAARAGLVQGDIITSVDGTAVSSADVLDQIALAKAPGKTVAVVYERDGESRTATLTLGTRHF